MDDGRLLRLTGLALPAGVWIIGLLTPPREGLTLPYLATFTSLLLAIVVVDQLSLSVVGRWAPYRVLLFALELLLCLLVVKVHGTLLRPALIYLLPTSRALVLFGERRGLALSLTVWLAYSVNIVQFFWTDRLPAEQLFLDQVGRRVNQDFVLWPQRLSELPTYLSFFLPLYIAAVVLTLATIRQTAQRRQAEALYDELRTTHTQLRAMHEQARELAASQERNRLAREIHDTLAHYLTIINLQLEAAEKLGSSDPSRAGLAVQRARRLTVECLQDVRRSVAALRASTLDELTLPGALRRLADEFAANTDIAVRLDLQVAEDLPLAPETALALYRATQEGLTNVQRHARAERVHLALAPIDGNLELTVQDDGRGPERREHAEDGFGLQGLRERVELLGGKLEFGGLETGGSRLRIVVPVGGNHERAN